MGESGGVSQWKFLGYYERTVIKAGGWPLVPIIDAAPTDSTPQNILGSNKNNSIMIKKIIEIKLQ